MEKNPRGPDVILYDLAQLVTGYLKEIDRRSNDTAERMMDDYRFAAGWAFASASGNDPERLRRATWAMVVIGVAAISSFGFPAPTEEEIAEAIGERAEALRARARGPKS